MRDLLTDTKKRKNFELGFALGEFDLEMLINSNEQRLGAKRYKEKPKDIYCLYHKDEWTRRAINLVNEHNENMKRFNRNAY